MTIQIKPATDNWILVYTPYNSEFVSRAKAAAGTWNGANKAWVFPAEQTAAVRTILNDIFGEDGSPLAAEVARVRLRCIQQPEGVDSEWPDQGGGLECSLAGRQVARAFGRDSGAKLGPDVVVVQGGFSSGGSRNNPRLVISRGTIVDLLRTPETIARRLVAEYPEHCRIVADDGSELQANDAPAANVVRFPGAEG